MKKVILTGVVLLLLVIIAVDVYNDHNQSNDKNKLQATATVVPGSTITAPAITPLGTAINADNNTQNMREASTVTTARRHSKHSVATRDDDDISLAANSPAGDVVVVMDEENGTPDIGAETSKAYNGNIPQTVNEQQKLMVSTDPEHRRIVHFGAEGSLMENSFYNVHSPYMDRLGFRAGAIVDIGLGDHFSLQPGLMYELKGIETENNTSSATMDVDTKDKINLNYLEVPLDLVVKFGDWHNCQFMVGAGPYIAYLLRAEDHYQTTTTTFGQIQDHQAARTTDLEGPGTYSQSPGVSNGQYSLIAGAPGSPTLNTLDWGLNGFVGVQMPEGLYAKAGTEVGLMNIQHNPDGSYSNSNYNFFVSLGYLIGYKK